MTPYQKLVMIATMLDRAEREPQQQPPVETDSNNTNPSADSSAEIETKRTNTIE